MGNGVQWTAIVLTCSDKQWTQPLLQELELRQSKGFIDSRVLLLVVEDPTENVGSGGATLNALLRVSELISAKRGYTVINSDVLQDSKILIVHCGRTYYFDACGRPFVTLPVKLDAPDYDTLICSLDLLVNTVSEKVAVQAPAGVWVCSADMVLTFPDNMELEWPPGDAVVVTVPSTVEYCRRHGVCKTDNQGNVQDILFRQQPETLQTCAREDGKVEASIGLTFFSAPVSERLLSFYTKPPLDACTYIGQDSGQPPFRLSLFFDVLLPMTTSVTEEDFVSGGRSGPYGQPGGTRASDDVNIIARRTLWRDLHEFRIRICSVEGGEFTYNFDNAAEHKRIILKNPHQKFFDQDVCWDSVTHSWLEHSCRRHPESVVINSVLKGEVAVREQTVVNHCRLRGNISVGRDSLLCGLDINDGETRRSGHSPIVLGDALVLQMFRISLRSLGKTRSVLTVFGCFDNIEAPLGAQGSTFCNESWEKFMERTSILPEDLWQPNLPAEQQTILTARMFPVFHMTQDVGLPIILWLQGKLTRPSHNSMLQTWRTSWRVSLEDIMTNIDLKEEFLWRRQLFYEVSQLELEAVLKKQLHKGFRCVYHTASVEGFSNDILETLDSVALKASSPGVIARTLANIADCLGSMAGSKGGLRSGPAANKSWRKAFRCLEKGEVAAGVAALAKERAHWLDRPDLLIRAARHYEGAAAILIRQAVMTAKEFFRPTRGRTPRLGQWVTADCPARVDLCGAWTDTPPITYEHGGAAVTVGVLINGKRPIGAKARRIESPEIRLVIIGDSTSTTVVCTELSDLEDYYQPHSPGALLKAAFVCADIVDMTSDLSLAAQLTHKYGGGFEVHSWSNLPHGSGLGTSSILAGAVLAAILTAAGMEFSTDAIIHAVLYLEQLLTTGGGWQDQVSGLSGGVKLGVSKAALPLRVEVRHLALKRETVEDLNRRLLLVYTGKTRLARNLLQDVVRNWYARNPHIVNTEDGLEAQSYRVAKALEAGDLDTVGEEANLYWQYKKQMAPGCEPATVTCLMRALRPHVHGSCLPGAGGGGFLYAVLRRDVTRDYIRQLLANNAELRDTVVYDHEVDPNGLTVTLED